MSQIPSCRQKLSETYKSFNSKRWKECIPLWRNSLCFLSNWIPYERRQDYIMYANRTMAPHYAYM